MKKTVIVVLLGVLLLYGCTSSTIHDPSTEITFSIAKASYVKLYVVNSYDTHIQTLVNRELHAGVYRYIFAADDLAEGVYFSILEIKDDNGHIEQTIKKPIILVK